MVGEKKIVVREVSRGEYDLGFSNYHASLFMTSEWIEAVLEKADIVYLHFEQDGEVVAKLSGMVQKGSHFLGKYLFLYASPALIRLEQALHDACLNALLRYVKKRKLNKIDLHYFDQQHEWVTDVNGFFKRGSHEYVRYFHNHEEPVKFSKSLMYNVRKAGRVNAVFHEETSERVLMRLHELLEETHRVRYAKYGDTYKPYPYYFMSKETLGRLMKEGILRLYYVEVDGVMHCVRCALARDKKMFGMMIASDEVTYKNGLQHFMQYNLITLLHEQGYKYYNIAGSAEGEQGKGLSDYKESLGCQRRNVYGAYTHFLVFPYTLINPVMALGVRMAKFKSLKMMLKWGSKLITGGSVGD